MPYKLRKAPGRELYWVVNKETGRHLSDMAISREKAISQLKALYSRENISGYKLPKLEKDMTKARMVKGSLEAKQAMEKIREHRLKKKAEEAEKDEEVKA